jgi:hypothetical protein
MILQGRTVNAPLKTGRSKIGRVLTIGRYGDGMIRLIEHTGRTGHEIRIVNHPVGTARPLNLSILNNLPIVTLSTFIVCSGCSMPSKPAGRPKKPRLPRAPLPRKTGGAHEDKKRRPFRKQKYRKPPSVDE